VRAVRSRQLRKYLTDSNQRNAASFRRMLIHDFTFISPHTTTLHMDSQKISFSRVGGTRESVDFSRENPGFAG
jgi:hypothetical protein